MEKKLGLDMNKVSKDMETMFTVQQPQLFYYNMTRSFDRLSQS
jgi:hypothetical protein